MWFVSNFLLTVVIERRPFFVYEYWHFKTDEININLYMVDVSETYEEFAYMFGGFKRFKEKKTYIYT